MATDRNSRLRIIVLGYLVRGPLGGLAWHHLQYMMGLADLGHDVYFIEDSGDSPWCCYDPSRGVTDADPTYGLHFAARTFDRLELGACWAYYDAHTARWHGPCASRIRPLCDNADLLLNLSGVTALRPWTAKIPARAFIDTDPVFTQIRHLTDPEARRLALQHTTFFSFGENIGHRGCAVPEDGLPWRPTRQPVVLRAWPVMQGPADGAFTTVMLWDSYPLKEYGGVSYGMKSASFQPYLDLPKQVGPILELAVGSPSAPRDELRRRGWLLQDPISVTRDPWIYQQYIQQSKAEWSVAKHGYVVSNSGWFSERSAAYLASGRPVVVQETGFSKWLESGVGVIPFSTPEGAVAGIEAVNNRYAFHCKAARTIVEEYFDARKVLPHLIERAMNATELPAKDSAKESHDG